MWDGWLAPDGTVYPLPSWSIEHASAMRLGLIPVDPDVAKEKAMELGMVTDDPWKPWQNHFLMHVGWVRLKNMRNMLPGKECLFADYTKKPNGSQRAALERLQFDDGWIILHGNLQRTHLHSVIVDQNGRMSGITHLPTGFRIHVPREVIPQGVRRVFQEDEEDDDPEVGKIATALAEAGASVPVKEKLKDAYIIKGNPEVMGKDIGKYDEFYNAVANVLQQKGLSVGFDAGLPHTLPPGGKYWIGHSRGIGRLRFAPEGVKTLRLDDFEPEETRLANEAAAAAIMKELGVSSFADVPVEKRRAPGPEHYTLNDEAIAALQALVDQEDEEEDE